jgi:hypothetical protein
VTTEIPWPQLSLLLLKCRIAFSQVIAGRKI